MCNFSIPFTGTADDLVTKLNNAITAQGGSFDPVNKTFSVPTPVGTISGTYDINGNSLDVVITHKPIVLSCSKIENYIKNFGVEGIQPAWRQKMVGCLLWRSGRALGRGRIGERGWSRVSRLGADSAPLGDGAGADEFGRTRQVHGDG